MDILILGGTVFLGRHLVEVATQRGHHVSLFNRGLTNPDLFPELEHMRGDRDGELEVLLGRQWDAAIDTSGYLPRVVRLSAEFLSQSVQHYTFISTISVYKDFDTTGMDEQAAVGIMEDQEFEVITEESYGPLKVRCEEAARIAMPGRVLIIRPGLIVGPHDPTDRFTYWPAHVARGGEILAPAPASQAIQYIDARDLSHWIIQMIEAGETGVYNATGPEGHLSLQDVLHACQTVTDREAVFTWVDPEFLIQQGVSPWSDIPLWTYGRGAGFMAVDCSKAISAGLSFRPLEQTIRDTLAWDQLRGIDAPRRTGLDPKREADLLNAWRQRA